MGQEDRQRWDDRYSQSGPAAAVAVPDLLIGHGDLIPTTGRALDIACGQGQHAVWLATRGLQVWGLDVSEVAIKHARELARRNGVDDRCRFDAVDLDEGLPDGEPVNIILCNKFRDRQLDRALIARLAPGGVLAITTLSEVGAAPGPFRAAPGELPAAFADLAVLATGEGGGRAWLLARA